MKKKEKFYPVNNQEDEDGYTLLTDARKKHRLSPLVILKTQGRVLQNCRLEALCFLHFNKAWNVKKLHQKNGCLLSSKINPGLIEDTVSFENNCLRNFEDCLGARLGGEDPVRAEN